MPTHTAVLTTHVVWSIQGGDLDRARRLLASRHSIASQLQPHQKALINRTAMSLWRVGPLI